MTTSRRGQRDSRSLIVLLALAAVWGMSYLFIKVAVRELPPETIVSGRLLLATLTLLLVLYARGLRLPASLSKWRDFFIVGISAVVLPCALIAWGEQSIPSSLAAILTATAPLFAVLGTSVIARDERMSGLRLFGIGLGFFGVVFTVGLRDFAFSSAASRGQLAVLAAGACYGLSGLYARKAFRGQPPLIPATGQLVAGSLVITPIALVRHGLPSVPSGEVLGAMLALAFVCTAVAYILFYWLMERIGAVRTSMVTYLLPPFALVYGWVLLDERVGVNVIAGLLFVIVGILLANGILRRPGPANLTVPPQDNLSLDGTS